MSYLFYKHFHVDSLYASLFHKKHRLSGVKKIDLIAKKLNIKLRVCQKTWFFSSQIPIRIGICNEKQSMSSENS